MLLISTRFISSDTSILKWTPYLPHLLDLFFFFHADILHILLKHDVDKRKQQKKPNRLKPTTCAFSSWDGNVCITKLQKRRMGDLQQDMTIKQTHSPLRKHPVIFRLTSVLHLQPSLMTIYERQPNKPKTWKWSI